MIDHLVKATDAFAGDAEQADDMTVIASGPLGKPMRFYVF